MASTASWDRRDLRERLGRGRISRSGKTVEGVSGDERYEASDCEKVRAEDTPCLRENC
jgi:hypothetical protein